MKLINKLRILVPSVLFKSLFIGGALSVCPALCNLMRAEDRISEGKVKVLALKEFLHSGWGSKICKH